MIDVQFTWRWRWWARPLLFGWVALARLGLVRCPRRGDVQRMIVVTVGAIALLGCPQPHPPPNPDASDAAVLGDVALDAGVCDVACANLAALGCAEGADPKCSSTCALVLSQKLTTMPLACWSTATSKEAARACGTATSGHLACP